MVLRLLDQHLEDCDRWQFLVFIVPFHTAYANPTIYMFNTRCCVLYSSNR